MRAVGRHCKARGLHIKMMYAPCIKTYTYNDNSESLSVSFSVSCSVSFSMYRFLYRVRWLHGCVGGGWGMLRRVRLRISPLTTNCSLSNVQRLSVRLKNHADEYNTCEYTTLVRL